MEPWIVKKAFISSTFKDLQFERDLITRYLIPRVNEALAPYRIQFIAIDLRSGVDVGSVNESERERRVLEVCINEIRESRPYFIGIIGERYGWVPDPTVMKLVESFFPPEERDIVNKLLEGKSVTELEILIGMLYQKELLSHSYVCFKDPDSFNSIPAPFISTYKDVENRDKLESLRTRVKDAFAGTGLSETHIIDYFGHWGKKKSENGDSEGFVQLDGFIEPLSDRIIEQILLDERPQAILLDESLLIRDKLAAYVGKHMLHFRGRDEFTRIVFQMIRTNSPANNHFCLVGVSGSGKSALLCNIYNKLCDESSLIVLLGVGGLSPELYYFHNVIKEWRKELEERIGETEPSVYNDYTAFTHLCEMAAKRGFQPVILLDAIDQFYPDTLPDSYGFIPPNIPTVVTCEISAFDQLNLNLYFKKVSLPPIDLEDARQIAEANLQYKVIPEVETLFSIRTPDNCFAYESPLWLTSAVLRVRELDSNDFLSIFDSSDEKIKAQRLRDIIGHFPSLPGEMFITLLKKAFDYFDKKCVLPSLIILSCSFYGENEDGLAALIKTDWDLLEFTRARQYFGDFINTNGFDKRMIVNHAIIKKAILGFDRELTYKYQSEYYDYLATNSIERLHEGDIEYIDRELATQLVLNGTPEMLQSVLQKYSRDIGDSLYDVYCLSSPKTVGFLKDYINRFPCDAITTMETFFLAAKMKCNDARLYRCQDVKQDCLELSDFLITTVIKTLRNGVPNPKSFYVRGFYNHFAFPMRFYSEKENPQELIRLLKQLKETSFLVKKRFGQEFYNTHAKSLFHFWPLLLQFINEADRYHIYLSKNGFDSEINSLICEMSAFYGRNFTEEDVLTKYDDYDDSIYC